MLQFELLEAPARGERGHGVVPVSVITMGAASAAVALLPPGVLAIKLSGVLTAEVLAQLRCEVARRYGHGARVYMVDYRDVVMAVELRDLDQAAERSPIDVSGALIVAAGDMQMFCQHARHQASAGLVRRVFPEAAAAISWAIRQASLD